MKICDQCGVTYPVDFRTCPVDNVALRSVSDLAVGMKIREKYLILEKLGEGGMATVYRARHIAFNELHAIKVVNHRFAEDERFLQRLRTEAILARTLQHPHAARVEDLDTLEDRRPFIVMELVEGNSLSIVVKQQAPIEVDRSIEIVRQVGGALAAAHQLGIVHRDVKPANIILESRHDGSDFAKLVDFGIAKAHEGILEAGPGMTLTQTGMVIGTPEYVSPEQALGRHGDDIDGRADIYSLSLVFYQMLTRCLPFTATCTLDMIMHQVKTIPIPPHESRPELKIPVEVSAVVMQGLEKDPGNRFQTVEEMIARLDDVQSSIDPKKLTISGTRMNETVVANGQALGSRHRRVRRAAILTLATIIGTVLIVGAWLERRNRQDARIRESVQRAVSHVPSASLRIDVSSHNVTLSGTVSTADDVPRVSQLAEQVPDVSHVINLVLVARPESGSNAEPDHAAKMEMTGPQKESARALNDPPLRKPSMPHPAKEVRDGRDVMITLIKSMGGWVHVNSIRGVATTVVSTIKMPGLSGTLETEEIIVYPNRRWSKWTNAGRTITMVSSSEDSFVKEGDVTSNMPEEMLRSRQTAFLHDDIYVAQHMTDPQFRFNVVGTQQIGGVATTILRVTAMGDQCDWYVDMEKGRALRQSYTTGGSHSVLRVEDYSEWASYDGVNIALTQEISENGVRIGRSRITAFRINPPFEPSLFAR